MLALAAYRRGRCPGCGGDLAETTNPDNEGRYQRDLPVQCFRCLEYARAADAYQDQPHAHTYLHVVRLKPKRG